MELQKLLTIGFLLCSLTCILLETVVSSSSVSVAFGMQDKAEFEERTRENRKAWPDDFRGSLWILIKSFVPPTAIFALFFSMMLMGILCCLT
ncbi:PREDICTED: small integral membrane protein 9-like [Chrysochloris asiatica]|uniref:Small integral membrane protein 9-like n=1 Tax=Chrysochloris asiatica TaxID=185453 RepID=A0A9B0X2L2_CHRAS|nr:PREDICTED: small integral membrane protein 9-like [Chrysochloris asiatica]